MVNQKRDPQKSAGKNKTGSSSPSFGIKTGLQFLSANKDYIAIGLLVALIVLSLFVLKPSETSQTINAQALEERLVNLEKAVSALTDKTNELGDVLSKTATSSTNSNQQSGKPQVLGVQKTASNESEGANSQLNSGKVNLNSASVSELDSLPGIGPAYAQRIIDYRNANNGFKSIEEVKNIKGIGDKTFEKFKDKITI